MSLSYCANCSTPIGPGVTYCSSCYKPEYPSTSDRLPWYGWIAGVAFFFGGILISFRIADYLNLGDFLGFCFCLIGAFFSVFTGIGIIMWLRDLF